MRPALVVEASRMTARIITWHNCISRTIVDGWFGKGFISKLKIFAKKKNAAANFLYDSLVNFGKMSLIKFGLCMKINFLFVSTGGWCDFVTLISFTRENTQYICMVNLEENLRRKRKHHQFYSLSTKIDDFGFDTNIPCNLNE